MSITEDTLRTVAIMDDSAYLRGAERISRATSGLGQSAGFDRLAGGLTLAGGLMVGLEAKAIKQASAFQQMEISLKRLSGSDALFENLKKYTFDTPYTTSEWADQARMLMGFGVAADQVIPTLRSLGDAVTGVYGVDPARLKQLTYAYAEMNVGFANARHVRMFTQADPGIYKDLEKYMGLTEPQIANIGTMHIPGKFVNAAAMEGIRHNPAMVDAQAKAMKSLAGQTANLNDAWQQFLANAGTGALEPVTHAIGFLSNEIKSATNPGASKMIGWSLLMGGPALLATGPIMRAIGLWKTMAAAKKLAAAASDIEKNAELAKLPVLEEETAGVTTATTQWGAFGTAVAGVGAKMLTFATRAGVAAAAFEAFDIARELSGMSDPENHTRKQFATDYDAFAQNKPKAFFDSMTHIGRTMTYGWKATSSQGNFERYQAEAKRIIDMDKSGPGQAAFARSKPEIDKIIKNWANTPDAAVTKMVEHLNTIVNNADDYKSSGQGLIDAQQAAADKKNDALLAEWNRTKGQYLKNGKKGKSAAASADPMAQSDIAEDKAETLMRIAQLRYKRSGAEADHKAYNAARKQTLTLIDAEIAGLTRHAAAIEHVAGKAKEWISTEKRIQGLMEKHEEFSADGADKQSKLDKYVAKIFGGGGISEDDILKRTGVGRGWFAGRGGGKAPVSPLHAALAALQKRPLIVNFRLGDKIFEQLKTEITDDAVSKIVRAGEGSSMATLFH